MSRAIHRTIFAARLTWRPILILLSALAVANVSQGQGLVDPRTGALVMTMVDLSHHTGTVALEFIRTLAPPADQASGLLGAGWRSNWERRLVRYGTLVAIEGEPGTVLFRPLPEVQGFESPAGGRVVFGADGDALHSAPNGRRETYDKDGRLRSITYPSGDRLVLNYDDSHRLSRIADQRGNQLALRYDALGRMVRIEDRFGVGVCYGYEGNRLTQVSPDGGRPSRYRYDDMGRLVWAAQPPATAFSVSYDAEGRVVGQRFADGREARFRYGDRDQDAWLADGSHVRTEWSNGALVGTVTDVLGAKTVARYGQFGLPTEIQDSLGRIIRYHYDEKGRLSLIQEPSERETRYHYLENSRLPVRITQPDGTVERYEYDAVMRLVGVHRDSVKRLQLGYDATGQITHIEGAAMAERWFEYRDDGLLVSETDALGQTTRYRYDAHARLIERTAPDGGHHRYRYDGAGRLLEEILPGESTIHYGYDQHGRPVERIAPDGGRYRYRYDEREHLAAETDPLGREITVEYDAAGFPVHISGAGAARWHYDYNAAGWRTRAIDPLGGETRYRYDAIGRLESEIGPTGLEWRYRHDDADRLIALDAPEGQYRFEYDSGDRLTRMEQPGGLSVRYRYDARHQLQRVDYPDGLAREYAYDDDGRLARVKDNQGRHRAYRYDAVGQVMEEQREGGQVIDYRYDAAGRVVERRDNAGPDVTYRHDAAGRVQELRYGNLVVRRFRYDPLGRPLEMVDGRGGVRRFVYDAAGQLTGVQAPSGEAVGYSYLADGTLAAVQHPGGGVERYSYDAMGNLRVRQDRLGAKTRFGYDAAGRVLERTDPDGHTTEYGYDAAGRLTRVGTADGLEIARRYDAAGNIVELDDGTFPVRYRYDAAGWRIATEYPVLGRRLGFAYDESGRLAAFTDAEGRRISYRYDEAGRLAAIELAEEARFDFTYDPAGRVIALRYPNGVKGEWRYDEAGRVASIAYLASDGTALFRESYHYDGEGDLLERSTDGVSSRYQYDGGGRLTNEAAPEGEIEYEYGPDGDRLRRVTGGETLAYAYDGASRIRQAGSERFRHDTAGRLTERVDAGGTTRYRWDGLGRLAGVERSAGPTVTFGYDPSGRWVRRQVGEEVSWFVYDDDDLVAELDGNKRTQASYLHGPDIDQPLLVWLDGVPHFLHADRLGSVVLVTDGEGRPVARARFDAFGGPASQGGELPIPLRFTARYYEPALGLYYYRARWYDPDLGRFLSPDPFMPDLRTPATLNRYVYALNAPTRYRDPLGAMEIPSGFTTEEARQLLQLRTRLEFLRDPFPVENDVSHIYQQVEDAMWLQRFRRSGEGFRIIRDQWQSELQRIQNHRVAQAVRGRGPATQVIVDTDEAGLPRPRTPRLGRGQGAPEHRARGWRTARSPGPPSPISRTEFELEWEAMQRQAQATTGRQPGVSDGPDRLPGNELTRRIPPDPAQQVRPGDRPAPGRPLRPGRGVGESALNVAAGLTAAFSVTSLYASYNACLEITRDEARCWEALFDTLKQAAAAGVITTAAAVTLGALVPAAIPVLIAAGVLPAGYGAYQALDLWANAPAIRAEAQTGMMQRELIVRIDDIVVEVQREAEGTLSTLANEARDACRLAKAQIEEAQALGARCDARICSFRKGLSPLEALLTQCADVEGVRSSGDILSIMKAAEAKLAALQGDRSDIQRADMRLRELGVEVPRNVKRATEGLRAFNDAQQRLLARIRGIQALLPAAPFSASWAEPLRHAHLQADAMLGWARAPIAPDAHCGGLDPSAVTEHKLNAAFRLQEADRVLTGLDEAAARCREVASRQQERPSFAGVWRVYWLGWWKLTIEESNGGISGNIVHLRKLSNAELKKEPEQGDYVDDPKRGKGTLSGERRDDVKIGAAPPQDGITGTISMKKAISKWDPVDRKYYPGWVDHDLKKFQFRIEDGSRLSGEFCTTIRCLTATGERISGGEAVEGE